MQDVGPGVMKEFVSPRRHRRALEKELAFWSRRGIVERQSFRTERYEQPIREALLGHCTGGSVGRVLEVGCGPACVARCIAGAATWYLDPLLDEYERLSEISLPPGRRMAAAIEDARLPPGFFDVVVCLNTIDHVRDPRLALASMNAAARPGGLLLLSAFVRGPVISFLRNLQERLNLSTDIAHPFSLTAARVDEIVRRTGFVVRSRRVVVSL